MKKFVTVLLLIISNCGFSSPVGNPYSPELIQEGVLLPRDSTFSFRSGYIGNFVTDNRMRQRAEGSGMVDNFELIMNMASLTVNFSNRIDFYANLGRGKIKADWRISVAGVLSHVEAKSNHGFCWGLGTNVLLLDWGRTAIGIGGNYYSFEPPIDWITIDDVSENAENGIYSFSEWQLNAGISHKISYIVPYIGILYEKNRCKINTPNTTGISQAGNGRNHFRNKDHFGFYLGCSLAPSKIFMLNIEGRLLSEEAASLEAQIRF